MYAQTCFQEDIHRIKYKLFHLISLVTEIWRKWTGSADCRVIHLRICTNYPFTQNLLTGKLGGKAWILRSDRKWNIHLFLQRIKLEIEWLVFAWESFLCLRAEAAPTIDVTSRLIYATYTPYLFLQYFSVLTSYNKYVTLSSVKMCPFIFSVPCVEFLDLENNTC